MHDVSLFTMVIHMIEIKNDVVFVQGVVAGAIYDLRNGNIFSVNSNSCGAINHYIRNTALTPEESEYISLLENKGVVMCNLRVGHIVSLVDARKVGDEVQALVIDSARDCIHDRVMNHVCEVIEDSAIWTTIRNENGLVVGEKKHHAMYWVNTEIIRDFNLLHAIK